MRQRSERRGRATGPGLTSHRATLKKFVKAFADATRYIVENREGTQRPLIQLLNTSDTDVVDFAYKYLHANSETTLYPPEDAVKNSSSRRNIF